MLSKSVRAFTRVSVISWGHIPLTVFECSNLEINCNGGNFSRFGQLMFLGILFVLITTYMFNYFYFKLRGIFHSGIRMWGVRFQQVCRGCNKAHRLSSAVGKGWDGFQFRDLEGQVFDVVMWSLLRKSLLRKGLEDCRVCKAVFVFCV